MISCYSRYINDNKKIIKEIKNTTIDVNCLVYNSKLFKTPTVIGTPSKNAEILSVFYCLKDCVNIVAKTVPLKYKDLKDLIDKQELRNQKFTEIFFMKLTTEMILKNVTPNLPIMFGNTICLRNCKFSNKKLIKNEKDIAGCNLILVPKADLDFKNFLSKCNDYTELVNAYFQIFMGLYILNTKYNIDHHDMHYGNVLVKEMDDKEYFRYKIKGKYYTIKANNLFYIWDFGIATIHNVIVPKDYTHIYESERIRPFFDYERILTMLIPSDAKLKSLFIANMNGDNKKINKILLKQTASEEKINRVIIFSNVYKKIIKFLDPKLTIDTIITEFAKLVSVKEFDIPKYAQIDNFNTDKQVFLPNNIKVVNERHIKAVKKEFDNKNIFEYVLSNTLLM